VGPVIRPTARLRVRHRKAPLLSGLETSSASAAPASRLRPPFPCSPPLLRPPGSPEFPDSTRPLLAWLSSARLGLAAWISAALNPSALATEPWRPQTPTPPSPPPPARTVSGKFHLQTSHCTARTVLGIFRSASIAEIWFQGSSWMNTTMRAMLQ